MERVLLTFGTRKSASTYAFQITRDLFAKLSGVYTPESRYPEPIRHPFVPSPGYLLQVLEETPEGTITVRKTHLGLDDGIRRAIEAGRCFPVFQIRDPLDVVASLIDAGEWERRKPPELQREGFTTIRGFTDTLPIVREDMAIARDWIELGVAHDFPCLDFEFVTGRPLEYLGLLAGRFGLAGDAGEIVDAYTRDTSRIWEFNRGETGRGQVFRREAGASGLEAEIAGFREFLRSVESAPSCRFGAWIREARAH